ncbi:MAG: ankyrin repeat domain-containing protein [Fretibacterium sp.]|nr:ankyrin repeat domain-containing protein [Fretibacterium sp.]
MSNRRIISALITGTLWVFYLTAAVPLPGAERDAMSDENFLSLCRGGSLQEIQAALQEGADVNAKSSDGRTALMIAVQFNQNIEVLSLLLKAGADINEKNEKGWTALMLAAAWNPNAEAVSLLLKAGADANAKDKNGRTALFYAQDYAQLWGNENVIKTLEAAVDSDRKFVNLCKKGSVQEIRAALQEGANPNARTSDGRTALIEAVTENPNAEAVSILLKAGADASAVDNNCMTALDYAQMWGNEGASDVLEDAADNDKKFINLCKKGSVQEILTALQNGANPNAKNGSGRTALMLAAARNPNAEVISILLKAGAKLNTKRKDGWTALMEAAAFNQNPEIISILMDAGADINAKNRAGRTALDLAQAKNNKNAVKALEAAY